MRTLKKLLLEKEYVMDEAKERVPVKLSKKELILLRKRIKKYKMYGQSLKNETDLLDLARTFKSIAKLAVRYVESIEDIDHLDETTLKKDIKALDNAADEFVKTAKIASKLHQRLTAAYEDMGAKLSRYFEMD